MRLHFIFLLFVLQSTRYGGAYPGSLSSAQLEGEEYLTDQHPTVSIIVESLWSALWFYPLEALVIGILISLMTYNRIVHNKELLSHEKLGISLGIIDKAQTPMTLIQNLLEDVTSDNISESASKKVKRALGHTNYVMDCHKNIIALNAMEKKMHSGFTTTEFELYTYLTLLTDQCRVYANMHRIQLNVSKSFNYLSCQVNEIAMTAALQCLLNKIIDITPCGGCINIRVSHLADCWSLQITNCPECDNKDKRVFAPISGLGLVHCYGSLRLIKKIIHLLSLIHI